MSINSSPYGPPQYFYLPPVNAEPPQYLYPPPVHGAAPINRPTGVQVADTAVFMQQTHPKSTSIGKAAKYGAGIGAVYSMVNLSMLLLSKGKRKKLNLAEHKIPALIGTFLGMGIKSAEGALYGALVGYFLKRSEKQG